MGTASQRVELLERLFTCEGAVLDFGQQPRQRAPVAVTGAVGE
jgi:hypothetical protein